ncbi:hypothetical protein [Streptomyces malaysiensis]|uniref:hypothetical protein n=1 Tax=Streptomyces malaysiensis TaxID=92644 RepID=UPI001E609AEC|nr:MULTISPECIES: hypothetical protein [unclassified Streptomyces]
MRRLRTDHIDLYHLPPASTPPSPSRSPSAPGNNKRIRTSWFDPANAAALKKALEDLPADLR